VTLTPTENGKKTQVTIQLIIPATDALDIAGAKILNDRPMSSCSSSSTTATRP